MREITTYSFINAKAFDQLALPADDPRRNAVRLLNPLGEEYAVMRTQLYSSMLTVLSTNFNRKIPAVRLFEAGKLFYPLFLPVTDQPDEVPAICLGMYGEGEDFFTLKGLLETLFSRFGAAVEYVPSAEPFLHPDGRLLPCSAARRLRYSAKYTPTRLHVTTLKRAFM